MTAIAEGLTLEDTALAELTAGLRGHVIGRGDPTYDEARKIWNGSIDKRPALIARCAGVADVMSAVKFAQQHGLRVAVRSGGHSFPGLSVADDAFVIDLSLMKGIRVDPYERTVDTLEAGRWVDPLFLIGADEFCDFLEWKDPEGVLARARLAVATRPGYPRERLERVLVQLSHPERVQFFEIEPLPISSRELRERVARGEPVDGLVPAAVAELIESRGLYRGAG